MEREKGNENIVERVRGEFANLKRENSEKKPEKRDPHLEGIDPGKITETEAELWEGLRRVGTTQELQEVVRKLEAYRRIVSVEIFKEKERDPNFDVFHDHRMLFQALVANKIIGKMYEIDEGESE